MEGHLLYQIQTTGCARIFFGCGAVRRSGSAGHGRKNGILRSDHCILPTRDRFSSFLLSGWRRPTCATRTKRD